jgi:hypothetical protein
MQLIIPQKATSITDSGFGCGYIGRLMHILHNQRFDGGTPVMRRRSIGFQTCVAALPLISFFDQTEFQ